MERAVLEVMLLLSAIGTIVWVIVSLFDREVKRRRLEELRRRNLHDIHKRDQP